MAQWQEEIKQAILFNDVDILSLFEKLHKSDYLK